MPTSSSLKVCSETCIFQPARMETLEPPIGTWVRTYLPVIPLDLFANVLACLNTAIGIAVFLEDSSVYNNAMSLFQEAVPSVIYLESDGKLPHAARGQKSDAASLKSHWFNQQTWGNEGQSGQIQVRKPIELQKSLTKHYL